MAFGGSRIPNGSTVYAAFQEQSGDCSLVSCHGGSRLNWYSSVSSCQICHTPGGEMDPLLLNGSENAGKHLKHVGEHNIACEKCHQGYKNAISHINGTFDTYNPDVLIIFFNAVNPNGMWFDDTGYGTGRCSNLNCHGSTTLDWYGPDDQGWVLPDCTVECHTTAFGTIRQVTGAGGDFDRASHHVIDYGDPTSLIVQAVDCLVCHEMNNHMGGTVRLRDKDNGGNVFAFNKDNPFGIEDFCLSCHDSDGATTEGIPLSPFSSSNILGSGCNITGDKIKCNWQKSYGHGRNGNHAPDDRLTCLGSGEPGTGCHGSSGSINAHGSVNDVLTARQYRYPVETVDGYYDETWFTLCFECHAGYAGIAKEDTLGVREDGILDNEAWLDDCSRCHFSYSPTSGAFPS